MAFPNLFGKRKPDVLAQDLNQVREANASAFDGLLGEIGALLSGERPADHRTAPAEPRSAVQGRPWPPHRH